MSKLVSSAPQPQPQQPQQQPQPLQIPDPMTKRGPLTTVELLWVLCKKATSAIESLGVGLEDLDGYLCGELKALCSKGRWTNRGLGLGWIASPELHLLILLNAGLAYEEIAKLMWSRFRVANLNNIFQRLIDHPLFTEFFERCILASKLRGLKPFVYWSYPRPVIVQQQLEQLI